MAGDTATNARGCGECKGATIGCNAIVGCYSCALYLHAREIEELKTKIPVTVISRAEYARLVEALELSCDAWLQVRQLIGGWRATSPDDEWSEYDQMCERMAQGAHAACAAALKAARESK